MRTRARAKYASVRGREARRLRRAHPLSAAKHMTEATMEPQPTSDEALIVAVARFKLADPPMSAAQITEALALQGVDATLSQVKKASSKAMKRLGKLGGAQENQPTQGDAGSSEVLLNILNDVQEKHGETMATVGLAVLKSGREVGAFVSGQISEKAAVEHGALPYAEQLKMSAQERNAYSYQRLLENEKRYSGFGRSVYVQQRHKAQEQLEEAKRSGAAPGREKRVVGFICGNEPPAMRARMWVDLLLCPSGEACLMGQCAWMTSELIGYDSLQKGCNADALEGMCAFLGLAYMAASGESDEIGAVVIALSERAEGTAPALLQWIAHQPVGQDYLYGGNGPRLTQSTHSTLRAVLRVTLRRCVVCAAGRWKRPSKSSPALAMSPLLYTAAAARVMNSLLRLLRLMADVHTHTLYPQARPFVAACLKAVHLPATIRRLLQLIARRGSLPEGSGLLRELPGLAITTLHSMCRHPSVAAALRQHPRASDVLAAQCGPAPGAEAASGEGSAAGDEKAKSGQEQEEPPEQEEQERAELRALLKHCVGELAAPSSRPPLPASKSECEYCAATCQRLKSCSCDRVKYCDAVCQKADWKQHKKVCPARKEKKEKKAAERAQSQLHDCAAPLAAAQGPTDPNTGLPLKKNANGQYKIGHLAGADGRVNMWEIPGGCGVDDRFDTPMNVRVPTEEMVRAVETQRRMDPKFDPVAQLQRLGPEGFCKRFM